MTTPVLQAQGAIAAVTTGNLSISLPSYGADDIVVITSVGWVPNSTGSYGYMELPSPWVKDTFEQSVIEFLNGTIDAEYAVWWARATSTSSLETSVTITRPTGWDTGPDTCWAGRAYVIRGCIKDGNPYDDFKSTSTFFSGGTLTMPGLEVYLGDRLVIQFFCSSDNLSAGNAPTGYTAGTAVTTTTGTDAGFQTFRISGASSTISSIESNASAPAQGFNVFFGASFKPPNPSYILIS
jgi:hypothetical protein